VAASQCEKDARICSAGFVVYRDANNDCEFCPCPKRGDYPVSCGVAKAMVINPR